VVSVTDPYGRILGFLDRQYIQYLDHIAWDDTMTNKLERIYKEVAMA
jgi:hypothetical protein